MRVFYDCQSLLLETDFQVTNNFLETNDFDFWKLSVFLSFWHEIDIT